MSFTTSHSVHRNTIEAVPENISSAGNTNINHEGMHWTANEYAEHVGSVKT